MKAANLYVATNLVNGKMYVGVTTGDVQKRWRRHRYLARSKENAFPLHHAIRKYRECDFVAEMLFAYPSLSEAHDAEKSLIAALDLTRQGYNATFGGEGVIPSEETRKKMSKAARARNPEAYERAAAKNRGRKFSEEHRAKLSAAARSRAPELRERMVAHFIGKPLSDDHRAKIAAANKDTYWAKRERL
jgi:group I intron endonuclease